MRSSFIGMGRIAFHGGGKQSRTATYSFRQENTINRNHNSYRSDADLALFPTCASFSLGRGCTLPPFREEEREEGERTPFLSFAAFPTPPTPWQEKRPFRLPSVLPLKHFPIFSPIDDAFSLSHSLLPHASIATKTRGPSIVSR